MGMSKIEIVVTGNHGCDCKAKEGEALGPLCDVPSCVDCRARRFVAELKANGGCINPETSCEGPGGRFYEGATLTHWPHDEGGGIVDDLLTGVRKKGHF